MCENFLFEFENSELELEWYDQIVDVAANTAFLLVLGSKSIKIFF